MNIAPMRGRRPEHDDAGAARRPRRCGGSRRRGRRAGLPLAAGGGRRRPLRRPRRCARHRTSVPLSGTGAKLIARISPPTISAERMPPRLSTGSLASFDVGGHELRTGARTSTTTASGSVTRNTDPHQKCWSSAPATSGPSAEIAPPSADHNAIALSCVTHQRHSGDERQGRGIGHAGRQTTHEPRRGRARRRNWPARGPRGCRLGSRARRRAAA